MTDDRRFERIAQAWLELGPTDAPDRLIDAAILEIDKTSQERDWHVPWRLPTMTVMSRNAAIAVAFVAVGVAAVLILQPGGSSGVGAPSATAPASIQSTAAPSPSSAASTASASRAPTLVEAPGFVVPFQMSWEVPVRPSVKPDVVDIFSGSSGMNVFNVTRVGKDPCHTNDLLASPLTTPQQFMDWLATIPKVTVGAVTTASIGGQAALERTVTVGVLTGCIDIAYLHSGIVSQYGGGSGGYFMSAGEEERWIAMAVHGKLIAIAIWPHGEATLGGAATRALGTLQFTP